LVKGAAVHKKISRGWWGRMRAKRSVWGLAEEIRAGILTTQLFSVEWADEGEAVSVGS
jgi:hypothetical protein